ncbi:hypothetical protein [Novosphingobium sp. KN65.2]|uniref:hypothetical protein n=1 Tax=Novosphingobium sp. KN65.2 TaxID=1478134 RepID=UPI0006D56A55|nr:hypothetical protein [Novosphingobium sp. KN65.2]
MNLRILKKLSKRAAPYLAALGDRREQFRAEQGENYHGLIIRDRTDWERSWCHPSHHIGWHREGEMYCVEARKGYRYMVRMPSHPLKGTIMVGAMEGYYEPEWDEETAYGALRTIVIDRFTCWEAIFAEDDRPCMTRDLSTVSKLFAAADEMVAYSRRQAA